MDEPKIPVLYKAGIVLHPCYEFGNANKKDKQPN